MIAIGFSKAEFHKKKYLKTYLDSHFVGNLIASQNYLNLNGKNSY